MSRVAKTVSVSVIVTAIGMREHASGDRQHHSTCLQSAYHIYSQRYIYVQQKSQKKYRQLEIQISSL